MNDSVWCSLLLLKEPTVGAVTRCMAKPERGPGLTSLPHRERNKRDCQTEFIQHFEISQVYTNYFKKKPYNGAIELR